MPAPPDDPAEPEPAEPDPAEPEPPELDALADLLAAGTTMALSGAGISTESGIPDYRGPAAAGRTRTPITYQEFVRDEAARRRYWARAMVGWRVMSDKGPNAGHRAIAELERRDGARRRSA